MNVPQLVDLLGIRMSDAKQIDFTEKTKLQALDNGALYISQKLHHTFLTELQVVEESLTATAGVYSLSSLSYGVLDSAQGIKKVKINGASGLWCTMIDRRHIKGLENTYNAGNSFNPICYVYANQIRIVNGTTNPVIDVHYLKEPAKFQGVFTLTADVGGAATTSFSGDASQGLSSVDDTYNGCLFYSQEKDAYFKITDYVALTRTFTVTPAASGNFGTSIGEIIVPNVGSLSILPTTSDASMKVPVPEMNKNLHSLILDAGTAEAWAMDGNLEMHRTELDQVNAMIDILNERVIVREGIGTK